MEKAIPHSRAILAATILGSSMMFIDGTAVNVILPQLQVLYGADALQIQWVVQAYACLLSALLLLGGALGDRFGRRRLFVIGTIAFVAASLGCAAAGSLEMLVVARALQGAGGALLTPASLAILTSVFPPDARGRAVGTWSGATAMTTAVGPVVGGWLAMNWSWRAIFFINLPVGALAAWLAARYVPENCGESRGARHLDWPGALSCVSSLGALVYGLIRGGAGWIVAGIFGALAFVAIEARSRAPMMPLGLFRSREFALANILTFLLYSALGGFFYFLPFNLIQVRGYGLAAAGAVNLPFVVAVTLLSRWSGGILDKFGARLPLTLGPCISAVAFFLLGELSLRGAGYWDSFFPPILLLGIGMALTIAPLTTTVLAAAGASRSGVASGINTTISRIAGLFAVAVFTRLAIHLFGRYLSQAGADAQWLARAGELAALPGPLTHHAYLLAFRDVMRICAALALASAAVGTHLGRRAAFPRLVGALHA